MSQKRKIEVFTAGCGLCNDAVDLVRKLACPSCEVEVLDMQDSQDAVRAKNYGVKSVPAVVIDGQLAECCESLGLTEDSLRAAGVGVPLA